MEDALNMVFVPDQIRRALLNGSGDFGRVLDFVLLYEQGDWREISRQLLMMDIPVDHIYEAYVDAIIWYGDLIHTPVPEGNIHE
jgi:EAL and modified HD-GYP domain-containing signal transduction protein